MFFAAHAKCIFSAGLKGISQHGVVAKGAAVNTQRFFGHLKHTDAFHIRGGSSEIFVNKCARQSDGFKNLRTGVRHVGRNAHLGHHFTKTFANGFDEIFNRLLAVEVCSEQAAFTHIKQRFHGEIRVDRLGAVAA